MKKRFRHLYVICVLPALLLLTFVRPAFSSTAESHFITGDTIQKTVEKIIMQKGQKCAARAETGVKQAAALWTEEDGTQDEFSRFCITQFIADEKERQELLARCESNLEAIYGYFTLIYLHLNSPLSTDTGPILPIDTLFMQFFPAAHMQDDFFKSRIAFSVLLNFPLYTLDKKLSQGSQWSRDKWAEVALAESFDLRIPSAVIQNMVNAYTNAETYLKDYHLYLNNLIIGHSDRPFRGDERAVNLTGLKDEIRRRYTRKDGLKKQKLLTRVMERIILQEIPAITVNNNRVDWDPFTNTVVTDGKSVTASPRQGMRYEHLRQIYRAATQFGPCSGQPGTFIDMNFDEYWQMPESTTVAHLLSILESPLAREEARLISKRLGRELEPFDIWYDGFRKTPDYSEASLDAIVSKRYPTIQAFGDDIPNLLVALGFSQENARSVAARIVVEKARYNASTTGAVMRGDKACIRLKARTGGMSFGDFYYAIFELGKAVENIISVYRIDHPLLRGLPNPAFTEAMAFIFQSHTLELLGLDRKDPMTGHYRALASFWSTFQRSGEALLCQKTWHWMYDHPGATSGEIEDAVVSIAKEIWNKYYAPVIGKKEEILLAMYSHLIDDDLFLPDRPMGRIIQYQLEEHLSRTGLRSETDRISILGALPPDIWMKYATGSPVSSKALLEATENALKAVNQ